jgi:hypothetical protein
MPGLMNFSPVEVVGFDPEPFVKRVGISEYRLYGTIHDLIEVL